MSLEGWWLMRISGKIVVGSLATIGAFVLTMWIVTWYQFIDVCEHQALARAVSPGGTLAAEHYRKRCDDGRPDEYYLSIGTPWQGRGATRTEVSLRLDAVRNEGSALSMQPLRVWWFSEKKLHLEVPPHDSVKVPSELGGVQIETQPFQ